MRHISRTAIMYRVGQNKAGNARLQIRLIHAVTRARHFALCRKGPGKRWGVHTKRKAACVATSGPGRLRCHKRPRSREETPKEGSDSGLGGVATAYP
jgi:hypothetical protein